MCEYISEWLFAPLFAKQLQMLLDPGSGPRSSHHVLMKQKSSLLHTKLSLFPSHGRIPPRGMLQYVSSADDDELEEDTVGAH